MIVGRRECGRIKYQIDSVITDFSHCHCSQCRRLHGAAFASFGGVEKASFALELETRFINNSLPPIKALMMRAVRIGCYVSLAHTLYA